MGAGLEEKQDHSPFTTLPHPQKCPCPSFQACLMGLSQQIGVHADLPHTDLAYSSLPPCMVFRSRWPTPVAVKKLKKMNVQGLVCYPLKLVLGLPSVKMLDSEKVLLGDIWQFYFPGTSAYQFWTCGTELLPRAHFQYKHSCLSFKNKELGPTRQNNLGKTGQVPVTFSKS